jgi:RimJ/RimL family protein N-acetyltransferase
MTLAHGTDRLESARLVLRRIVPDDLPFFTRIHGLPAVAQHLWPGGQPRSPEQTAAWLQSTLATYEQLALGYLAVLRKDDGALIGRCGLMDLVVEAAATQRGVRRGWFGDAQAPTGLALTFECELGYTFDPAAWGQGFASEAAGCVRDYARGGLGLGYVVSAILPSNARSRRVAERFGARASGQMEVVGLTFDRYVWPLAPGGAARPPGEAGGREGRRARVCGACRVGQHADGGGRADRGAVAWDGGDGGDQDGAAECDVVFAVAIAAVCA